MPALGVVSGPLTLRTTHIKLRGSLVSDRKQVSAPAAQLLHEGTHIIDAGRTVDFAYRGTGQHYFLPDGLALYNAANYEQVAVNAVGIGADPPPQAAIGAARRLKAQPELLAATLLTVQITQSWAYSVKLAVGQDPAGALPQVGPMLGLPPADEHGRQAMLAGLEAGLRSPLMGLIGKGVSFSVGAYHPDVRLVPQGDGSCGIQVDAGAVNATSARQLAAKGLRQMCDAVALQAHVPFSGQQLSDCISSFALFQEEAARANVNAYLSNLP